MFSELLDLVKKANEEYEKISSLHEQKKESKNILYQQHLNNELEKMMNGVSSSNYVPTKFNKDLKVFKRQHEIMNDNFEKETNQIKQQLYKNLLEIINKDHIS